MNFSQTAEYALRAVVWLAQHPAPAAGTARIARATKVPAGYLSKVLQALARAGVVASIPGRKGGFRLLRAPDRLSVLDVIQAVDPIARITRCPLKLREHQRQLCPLHRRLDESLASIERALAATTIAELLDGDGPFCEHTQPSGR